MYFYTLTSLLTKLERRLVEIHIDYIGFEIGDQFVIGYGLDYEEKFREMDYIAELCLEG